MLTLDERRVDMSLALPRIVLAGMSSGVGKTTMTTALIAHLRTRGIQVQPFKVGPDYIDPSHLALAAAWPCYNLDTWMTPPGRMLDVFCMAAASAEDRKSKRLNSSHANISYAVFCLKKKKHNNIQ